MSDLPLITNEEDILVAAPANLREACFFVPFVRALRNGTAAAQRVRILCLERQKPLWDSLGPIGIEILPVPEKKGLLDPKKAASALKAAGLPTAAITFEKEAAIAFAKAEINKRIGYQAAAYQKHLTHSTAILSPTGPVEHQVQYYLKFAHELGLNPMNKENFIEAERSAPSQPPILALTPGSDYGPSHQWAVDGFVHVARTVIEKTRGEVIIFEVTGKAEVAKHLQKKLGDWATIVPHMPDSMGEIMTLLASSTAMIASDNSLSHLAAHVGTPVVSIFGPNSVAKNRPLGRKHVQVLSHAECAPCFTEKCPLGADDHRCLKEVTPEMVLNALAKIPG